MKVLFFLILSSLTGLLWQSGHHQYAGCILLIFIIGGFVDLIESPAYFKLFGFVRMTVGISGFGYLINQGLI